MKEKDRTAVRGKKKIKSEQRFFSPNFKKIAVIRKETRSQLGKKKQTNATR